MENWLTNSLLRRQRTTYDADNIAAYALRVRKYLKPGDRVLDIGCGFGLVACALADVVAGLRFVLLDKTGDEPAVAFPARGYVHNDLAVTRRVAEQLDAVVSDVDDYGWTDPVDVVISTLSWGWHYPVTMYSDRVIALQPHAVILDVRNRDDVRVLCDAHYKIVDDFRVNRKETTVVLERQ